MKSLNAEAIRYAFEKRWLTEWEASFYFDIMRKRNLSQRQATKKAQINEKIALRLKRTALPPSG